MRRANPIRKVVNMLQDMEKNVAKEGEEDEKLYKKYMCYCSTSGDELKKSIETAENKGPLLNTGIEQAAEKKSHVDADLETAKTEREAATRSMAEATAIRDSMAFTPAKESSDLNSNI